MKSLSKENFLEMLHTQAVESDDEPEKNATTWEVLNEDMLMGATLKKWDEQADSEEDNEAFNDVSDAEFSDSD